MWWFSHTGSKTDDFEEKRCILEYEHIFNNCKALSFRFTSSKEINSKNMHRLSQIETCLE